MEKDKETEPVVKGYFSAFVLDKAKLARIIDVIETKLKSLKINCSSIFHVTFSRGNEQRLTSLANVITLDNTVRNPIESLVIDTIGTTKDGAQEITCRIFLEPLREGIIGNGHNVEIQVTSKNEKLALQILAEIDEQIQRILFRNWRDTSVFVLCVSVVISIIAGFLTLLIPTTWRELSKTTAGASSSINLSYEQLSNLFNQASLANSSDEKINFLFDLRKQEIEAIIENTEPQRDFIQSFSGIIESISNFFAKIELSSLTNLKTVFLVAPVILFLCCVFYAAVKCSPSTVFLWGDYESHYEKLVFRSRMALGAAFSTILLGCVTSLFVSSIWPYF